MRRLSSILYSVGLVISSVIGGLHFFAPYAFGWYSYIPDAPAEIYASIDYINFFFSLLLAGLSALLLFFKRQAFAGSAEVLAFFTFLVATWAGRVVITLVIPWPTSLQVWLVTAFATQFLILLVPAWYLWSNRHGLRSVALAAH